jgi:hypothetical protein
MNRSAFACCQWATRIIYGGVIDAIIENSEPNFRKGLEDVLLPYHG